MIDFRTTPSIEGLRATVGAKQAASAQSPAGLAVLNFLAPGPLPSAEVRKIAAEVQEADHKGVLCHATVVEATGFAGSAMRSVLTGMRAFDRSPFPRKVFGDVDETLSWLATTSKASADWLIGARAAVDELRRRR
jgi:hypothetical protein